MGTSQLLEMYHKAPAYGSGNYARPINRAPKVGFQEPRADVARPFKTADYGNGAFNKYKIEYAHKSPEERGERYIQDPSKVASERKLTVGTGTMSTTRDQRLNPTKTPYGQGHFRGNSYIKPGGNTGVTDPRANYKGRTVPKMQGGRNEGSVGQTGYGQGVWVPDHAIEHEDCKGFNRLHKAGVRDPSVLTSRPDMRRLGPDDVNKMHGAWPSPAPLAYGAAAYAHPSCSRTRPVSAPLDAGHMLSTRQQAIENGACDEDIGMLPSEGRAHYHEGQSRYLPTHREAVTGYHFPVPEYGHGNYASSVRPGVEAAQAARYAQPELGYGMGAFASPRSGCF